MTPYRPSSPLPLSLDLGLWQASGQPDRRATLTCDPKLFSWLVNAAAKRSSNFYRVNYGQPPLQVDLV